jgi:hypothetical protein
VTSATQDYESFIGSAYAAPIFVLLERLEGGRGTVNEVQASVFEYGHAASIIALTVLFLESYLNVSKHLTGSHERSVRTYFANTFPASAYSVEITELFAVRDVIAHNHVWKGQIDPYTMTWVTLGLLPGYGDKQFQKIIDPLRRTTKKLGLNVVPTRLNYADVRTVIKTTAAILLELRAWHLAQPVAYYLGTTDFGLVTFRGQLMHFLEAADSL